MRILLAVTGGIAAYKAVEILRTLQNHGVEVDVLMTRSARRFITPLTFSSLTGKPVHTSLWQPELPPSPQEPIEHITLAQTIDALLIAPATANTLARLAHGLAHDLLGTVYLATQAPVILAPAMNVGMWRHPATQATLKLLADRGAHIVEPESGYLACGMTGAGRLASPEAIALTAMRAASPVRDLAAETVLITAGGTREPIDPVRYLGNRSSGKMGHALADAALARGARVILITASPLPSPAGAQAIRTETAAAMQRALERHLPDATIVVAAAAVADFRPAAPSSTKLRRQGPLLLELQPTPDLVAQAVAQRRPGTLVIAFAAEMEDLEENARAKLLRKGADAIVANNVADPAIGFESDTNAGLFLTRDRTETLPLGSKRAMADRILDQTLRLRSEQTVAPEPSSPVLAQAR